MRYQLYSARDGRMIAKIVCIHCGERHVLFHDPGDYTWCTEAACVECGGLLCADGGTYSCAGCVQYIPAGCMLGIDYPTKRDFSCDCFEKALRPVK
jgi:hypothetical protein